MTNVDNSQQSLGAYSKYNVDLPACAKTIYPENTSARNGKEG